MTLNDPSASPDGIARIRPAVSADQQKIADLIFFESHVHRHLDWRAPLDWIGVPPYWVFQENNRLIAALACPPDPDSIAWIRLFAFASHLAGPATWRPLWEAAQAQLGELGGATAAAIATERWLEPILTENGFRRIAHIVMLEWNDRPPARAHVSPAVNIRAMTDEDLPHVVEVDAAAFDPLWRNSLPALRLALAQAAYASVAEDASGLIGYQLSTGGGTRGAPGAARRPPPVAETRFRCGAGWRSHAPHARERSFALHG